MMKALMLVIALDYMPLQAGGMPIVTTVQTLAPTVDLCEVASADLYRKGYIAEGKVTRVLCIPLNPPS